LIFSHYLKTVEGWASYPLLVMALPSVHTKMSICYLRCTLISFGELCHLRILFFKTHSMKKHFIIYNKKQISSINFKCCFITDVIKHVLLSAICYQDEVSMGKHYRYTSFFICICIYQYTGRLSICTVIYFFNMV
jgi:hypothetical protein